MLLSLLLFSAPVIVVTNESGEFVGFLNRAVHSLLDFYRSQHSFAQFERIEKFNDAKIYRTTYDESKPKPVPWSHEVAFRSMEHSCLFWKRNESYFCPNETINVTEWLAVAKKQHEEDEHRRASWMCNKPIAVDLRAWRDAPRTRHNQLSISVYSGDNIAFSRAMVCRDTWARNFPETTLIVSKHGEPIVPVVAMRDLYPRWFPPGMDPVENLQLFAYAEQLRRHPRARWFYTIGDDTYVEADYLLHFLDDLTPVNQSIEQATDIPRWVMFCEIPQKMPTYFNISRYEDTWLPEHRQKNQFIWCSGAVGWFLSRAAVEMFVDELETFLTLLYAKEEQLSWKNHHACDVTTGLLLTLLGIRPEKPPVTDNGVDWLKVFHVEAIDSRSVHEAFASRPHYHYVSPMRMITLDQRATHEKMDRMINAGRLDWLVEFMRDFVDDHYRMLRRKMIESRYLLEAGNRLSKQSWYDVPDMTIASNKTELNSLLRTTPSTEADVKTH
jgi:hypothetical protein